MATHSNVLRGRDSELLSIRNMLASATRGTGSHVIAWGGAGSGKSALLSAAGSLGRNQDFVVMQARGTYAEHRRPFTIARRLFESCRAQIDPDPVMRLLDSLPKEARDALTATDQLQDYSERLHRDLDVLDTALAQTANQGRPLLIVVDNVHWADHQSMCWLATLAERVEYLPVALLTSICGGIPGTDPHLLDELRVTSQQQLRLGRLGFSDTAAVLEERLEAPAVDETFVAACLRETDGNPLLLTELARQIRDSASALTPEAVGRQAESPQRR